MTDVYEIDGIEYTSSNHRMRYHPEFHENHGKPWKKEDLIYMCSVWEGTQKADIAAALGRTHGTVLSKANQLRRSGEFDIYKEMG